MQPGVVGGDVEVWLESFHGLYGRMEAQEVFPICTSKVSTFSSDFNLRKNTSGEREILVLVVSESCNFVGVSILKLSLQD